MEDKSRKEFCTIVEEKLLPEMTGTKKEWEWNKSFVNAHLNTLIVELNSLFQHVLWSNHKRMFYEVFNDIHHSDTPANKIDRITQQVEELLLEQMYGKQIDRVKNAIESSRKKFNESIDELMSRNVPFDENIRNECLQLMLEAVDNEELNEALKDIKSERVVNSSWVSTINGLRFRNMSDDGETEYYDPDDIVRKAEVMVNNNEDKPHYYVARTFLV